MGEKLKVLVVDDDQQMVKTICDILRVKGHEALCAYCGEDAVEMVKNGGPECVLMDVKMPGIDGIEALKMIKCLTPDLPVLLMSAYATGEQAEEAKREGAFTILTKPVDLQLVLRFLSILRKDESVLIVDDDPDFCGTLGDILQARGYRVETETDAANVLMHLERSYKLAVVLDLKLGTANGLDIFRKIRTRYPSKPVVLVTGYGEELAASIEKGLGIGACACLRKPFEIEELVGIIEEISRNKLRALLGEPVAMAGQVNTET